MTADRRMSGSIMTALVFVPAVSIALLTGCGDGGADHRPTIEQRVDAVFARYTAAGSPGTAVMVIRGGDVLHAKGYGLADIESGRPLTRSTPIRLASVTKQFTAMAVMLLAERGEVELDAPVTPWVPELRRFEGITVRHLLNHTAGLPDYYRSDPIEAAAEDTDRSTPFDTAAAVSTYASWGEPRFAPGARFEYSNPGYEVLALVVERASGSSLGTFLEANLFEPIGMTTSAFRDGPDSVIPGRAIGYSPGFLRLGWTENDDHPLNWVMGAGGLYASLDDLYQWDQALWRWAEEGRLDEAFAPAVLADGTTSAYGFGWNLSDRLDRAAIHHSGGWVGFRTAIARYPEEALTVIVLTNASARATELGDRVAALFLER